MEKPKLNLNKIVDKTEEERRLKNLLRDDFIDDGPDTDEKMHPLMLPRVKKDIYDTLDNDKTDKKPVISENGESKCKISSLVILSNSYTFFFIVLNVERKSSQDGKEEFTISQIIENKTNSYTLIQVRISCNPL